MLSLAFCYNHSMWSHVLQRAELTSMLSTLTMSSSKTRVKMRLAYASAVSSGPLRKTVPSLASAPSSLAAASSRSVAMSGLQMCNALACGSKHDQQGYNSSNT